jgi:hypothetical protein
MAQRDNRHLDWVLGMHPRAAGPPGRFPVQPSTPLGLDQVNVFYFILFHVSAIILNILAVAPGAFHPYLIILSAVVVMVERTTNVAPTNEPGPGRSPLSFTCSSHVRCSIA